MTGLTADELIHLLVENEWDERQNRSMERSLSTARYCYKTTVEGLNFHPERMLHKNQLLRLTDGGYIKKGENIMSTVETGKSYVACAVRNQVCDQGRKVL